MRQTRLMTKLYKSVFAGDDKEPFHTLTPNSLKFLKTKVYTLKKTLPGAS